MNILRNREVLNMKLQFSLKTTVKPPTNEQLLFQTEINLFFPEKSEYFIETYGYNTVHYWAKLITEIPPSRKKENSKMMVIGDKENPNKIKIHITNGIVRFGEDFIDIGK